MMDNQQDGRSPADAGSGHQPSASAVPASQSGVPNALVEAIGGIVSMCADARDVFPDSEAALDCVTEAVNELYGCVEDGVFGPVQAGAWPVTREDIAEFCDAVLADNMPRHDEPYRTIARYINAARRRAYAAGHASAAGGRSPETNEDSAQPVGRQSGDGEASATPNRGSHNG